MNKLTKKNKNKLALVSCLLVVIIALSAILGYMILNQPKQIETVVKEDGSVEVVEYTGKYYREFYKSQKKLNKDYVGQIFFESGLINQPFVQGETNDTYLRTNWITNEYDVEGSNFLDAENTLDDQNLVIYGHYVFESLDPTLSHKFTPLEKLWKKENYASNNKVFLLLENEIREYEIATVFAAQLFMDENGEYYLQEEEQYHLPSYEEEYFKVYHDRVKKRQQYETGVDFTYNDKLLTLQTCTKNREDLREIVICVQVNSYKLDNKCTFKHYDMSKSSERFAA